ncbi:zinc-dependent alcohol dehydrogenase family protein [Allokutzneria multivorans]|uniref:Zinc-dependent alcohol dehydrogenase family protein n=1 Tax=Allokutzneria multivorans TaxID=1142134 RepID=A0ABP7SF03_9PSEU
MEAGRVLGHEAVGTIESVGPAVLGRKPGDWVLISCITACGRCDCCRTGTYGRCQGGGGWTLGHTIDGTQAEYVRVSFADTSTHLLPEAVCDAAAVMLADILPTSYEVGVLNGRVTPGDTVVVVDLAGSRLDAAKLFGADIAINASDDPMTVIAELTDDLGADTVIEAIGVPESFELCTRLVHPGGQAANVGVHGKPATLHLEELLIRDITLTTGVVDTNFTPRLLRMLAAGRLDAERYITHRYRFDEFETACNVFSRRAARPRPSARPRPATEPRHAQARARSN